MHVQLDRHGFPAVPIHHAQLDPLVRGRDHLERPGFLLSGQAGYQKGAFASQVKAGIRKGLEVMSPERLYIDPDCGLKTRSEEESVAKLRIISTAVKEVKAELGIE